MGAVLILLCAIAVVLNRSLGQVAQSVKQAASVNSGSSTIAPANAPALSSFQNRMEKQNFTDFQLKAMLSECYWTENDTQAAALLVQYPRLETYKSLPFGSDYVDYLKKIETDGELELTSDPYFIDPVESFCNLSVADTPRQWLPSCSKMRSAQIPFSASEMFSTKFEKPSHLATTSKLRILESPLSILLNSVEEEESLLATLSPLQKTKLPSLYAAELLDSATLAQILERYTVRELADSWIGPKQVLAKIEASLSPRRRELLASLKPNGNRSSAAFRRLAKDLKSSIRSSDERKLKVA